MPAASGPEQIVVNGMSASHRGSRWSNSGMVVEIRTEDLLAMDKSQLTMDSSLQTTHPDGNNYQLSTINSQLGKAADPIVEYMSRSQLEKSIARTRKLMQEAAKQLNFAEAAQYRDEMFRLEELLKTKE